MDCCPLCGKPVQENDKAFGCTAWREGCHFTVWKNCLERGGGPVINKKIMEMLLKSGSVRGSTGTITLQNNILSFADLSGKTTASCSVVYEKKT